MNQPGFGCRVLLTLQLLLLALVTSDPVIAGCVAAERGREAVLDAVLARDGDRFAGLIDGAAMAARISRGLPEGDAFLQTVPRMIEERRAVMGNALVRSLGNFGTSLVAQPSSAPSTAIVRKQGATLGSGIDYIVFELGPDGCVIDWSSLLLATRTSDMIRQNLLFGRNDAGLLATVLGIRSYDEQQLKQLQAMVEGMRKSDAVAALRALDGMKSLARESFELSMLRVSLLSTDSESAAYREALEDVAQRFGEQPRMQLMLIDHYVFQENYVAILRAVDGLQKRVGPDEESEYLRALALQLMERHDDAIVSLRRVVQLAPARSDTHEALISSLAELGRNAEAVKAMEVAARHNFDFNEDAMRADPAYAQLLDSPEYAAFRSKRATN